MFGKGYVRFVQGYLPSPFSLAVLLTLLSFVMAFLFSQSGPVEVLGHWYRGFWELLAFSMQMVLILVLGHSLALSPPAQRGIQQLSRYANTTPKAAALIGFCALFVGLLNWGLCLIFGAILARRFGEKARQEGLQLHYPLLAAAGYSGMMVWHGGFSGSAPLVIAQEDHFLVEEIGQISVSHTLLSPLNLSANLLMLLLIPSLLYFLGTRVKASPVPNLSSAALQKEISKPRTAADRLDKGSFLARLFACLILFWASYTAFNASPENPLRFLDLDFINFCLFGFSLLLHGTVWRFLSAIQEAIAGASGIIIQFPLYAGIMGIMKYSGLITAFSASFVTIASAQTLPIFTFLSAGLVNLFVPSGGGQWAVQGPIIVEAAEALGVPLPKAILALAYGDGLTNMLQPFWALPLLGITRLDARDILPYSSIMMLAGGCIYLLCLWWF